MAGLPLGVAQLEQRVAPGDRWIEGRWRLSRTRVHSSEKWSANGMMLWNA